MEMGKANKRYESDSSIRRKECHSAKTKGPTLLGNRSTGRRMESSAEQSIPRPMFQYVSKLF
ncbi:hypothetical protein RHMOL_Rhmol11G0042300 [Rhododendron molle]|uniref:Uncharacterized protein n=1 Tax=Rhododendron molle TaxID=49168 RepID=A0ACC0LPR1_RHOML|nr:hypothetical protein RHMOL_Rhmol11G0042300 [Rhododendron molle]